MAFRPAKCSSCGKDIQIPDDRDVAVCMYCGGSISVGNAVQITIGASAENLLTLARTATVAGNYAEAYNYYNRVLEIDPNNSLAWYGKGEAAGWLSNLNEFRFSEILVAFENALKFATNESKENLKQTCAHTLNSVATACYVLSRDHMLQFIALQNTWGDYIARCRQIISLYEAAHLCSQDNRQIIENIIHLCKDNIEGVRYKDPFENNISRSAFISGPYEKEIRDILISYGETLRKLDPKYIIPNPQRLNSGCFVVTATLGDEHHPSVQFLRYFRDNFLIKSTLGNLFVCWYYLHGPTFARQIEKSKVAAIVSYFLIVVPSVLIAKCLTYATHRVGRLSKLS